MHWTRPRQALGLHDAPYVGALGQGLLEAAHCLHELLDATLRLQAAAASSFAVVCILVIWYGEIAYLRYITTIRQ
jgi:hypothetical protein